MIEYLKNHTWIDTQNHFSLSPRTIMNIKNRNLDQNDGKKNDLPGINEPLKKAIKLIFDEMWDSLPTKSQKTIMEKYTEQINEILGVIA